MIQWILVANQATARVFRITDENKTLRVVFEIENPLSGKKISSLSRHKPGITMKTSGHRGGARHVAVGKGDVHRDVILQFAKEIAGRLNLGRTLGKFDHLSIIAAPQLLGAIRRALTKDTRTAITKTLAKDIENQSLPRIKAYINQSEGLIQKLTG